MIGGSTIEDDAARIVAFVRGRLTPSIRTLSVTEFRRCAEVLESREIRVTRMDIAKVLREFLQGSVTRGDFCDWIEVLSWGVHPGMIRRSALPQEGEAVLRRAAIHDDSGIVTLDITFEEAEHDTIVEVLQALEDACDAERGLEEEVRQCLREISPE